MTEEIYGPTLRISQEMHATKYRGEGETYGESATRVADALSDDTSHFHAFRDIIRPQRFMPAGRVQSSAGSPRATTAYNCFVMGTIPDSMAGIMRIATEAAETMRRGGGVGYDFSTVRPRLSRIVSMDTQSSGPVSFMNIFDAVCKTIASAGNRRGAMMAVLRVDHPDIEEFIRCKQNATELTQFNISIGITDEFMEAVINDTEFELKFDGRVMKRISAVALWDEIMRSTWDWAEPGVLFIDTINRMNNLGYCERIAATNPCAEQPLPPYGACLLGSFNLVKYVVQGVAGNYFDYTQLRADIPYAVRAMDNVIDRTMYPLPEQEVEAKNKRRMGIGVTGAANAIEALGYPYGSEGFCNTLDTILDLINNECYRASALLAADKGAFPLFDKAHYADAPFINGLDDDVQELIFTHGLRNSHLTSIAPTGTISLCADNVSSGIEPVFAYEYDRTIQTVDGPIIEHIEDYGLRVFNVKGKRTQDCTIDDHLAVLEVASRHVDSAVSKTCNVDPNMPWDDFKDVYIRAWEFGAKGCTTFNPSGKRMGILNAKPASEEEQGAACYIDPETGSKTCE